jgi:hypothetical protein
VHGLYLAVNPNCLALVLLENSLVYSNPPGASMVGGGGVGSGGGEISSDPYRQNVSF